MQFFCLFFLRQKSVEKTGKKCCVLKKNGNGIYNRWKKFFLSQKLTIELAVMNVQKSRF